MVSLYETCTKTVQFGHLRHKDSLASVTRVSYVHHFTLCAYVGGHPRRVVADGHQPARSHEIDHIRKQLFAGLPLKFVVQSIAK